jgi:hypothetical protein
MRHTIFAIVAVAVLHSSALGTHPEPGKANTAKFELIRNYGPCESPNTTTSNGSSACAPPFEEGDLCPSTLAPNASGKISLVKTGSAVAGNQDLKVGAIARGLDACEGRLFTVRLALRVTLDDCPEGSCTMTDFSALDLGQCIVTDGKCKIKTTLNTASPGTIPTSGKRAGIQVLGCGLKELPLFLGFPPELTSGILLK